MVLNSVMTLFSPPPLRGRCQLAARRVWPTQRSRFYRSSPCIVGSPSSVSRFIFFVWSHLVCFASILIHVAPM